ncbi:methyltransferase [Microcella alkalica]
MIDLFPGSVNFSGTAAACSNRAVLEASRDRLVGALRADLAAADYTVDAVRRLWGDEADAALLRADRVVARRALRTAPRSPLATLARAFLLADPVDSNALAEALPSLGLGGARELGIAGPHAEGAWRALLDLRPYSAIDATGAVSWWIVSDLGELATGGALDAGHVLGVGGASTTLSSLIPTSPGRRVLDLGTGCGIQSLHAFRHAGAIVATDISRRALELAALTLRLNGIPLGAEGVDLRLGDLFAPVAGERFDRIVSNPPFVITPRRAGVPLYEYRDGGRVGDGIVEEVVRGVVEHLEPGGTAHLLGNWEYRDAMGGDGLARVRRWVEEAGLDAWIIERERQSPAQYAETWIRDGGTRVGSPEFEALAEEWLADFEARGVTGVGFGYMVLRRPSDPAAPRLVRTERLLEELGSTPTGIGDHLMAGFAAHDAIARLDDVALAGLRLRVAPDITEERHQWPGADGPTVIRLRQGGGFARSIDADAALAGLVGASDGELSVAQLIGALAQLLEIDEAALADDLLPRVRELVLTGYLTLDV